MSERRPRRPHLLAWALLLLLLAVPMLYVITLPIAHAVFMRTRLSMTASMWFERYCKPYWWLRDHVPLLRQPLSDYDGAVYHWVLGKLEPAPDVIIVTGGVLTLAAPDKADADANAKAKEEEANRGDATTGRAAKPESSATTETKP